MPENTATELANELRTATIDYLWRQWKAVGATASVSHPARVIVDPEALILMSLWLVQHEQRLADIVWSWTSINSSLLSIQRLRNLQPLFPAETGQNLSSLAALQVRESKDVRWKSLKGPKGSLLAPRQGKVRAVRSRLDSWATLMLQLRLGMGVGVKADVLTFLLGNSSVTPDWTSVAMIADALKYTTTAVRRAADDLARARFIRVLGTAESKISPHRMFSGQASAWGSMLGISTNQPGWGYLLERFLFVVELLTWLDREAVKPTSPYARNVRARDILTKHGLAIRNDRVVDPHEFAAADLNYEYLMAAARALSRWLENRG